MHAPPPVPAALQLHIDFNITGEIGLVRPLTTPTGNMSALHITCDLRDTTEIHFCYGKKPTFACFKKKKTVLLKLLSFIIQYD